MTQIPATIQRFFTPEGELRAMPSKQAPRAAVLEWLAGEVLAAGERLDEPSLNLRLRRFHPDVAMLRRYMIEQGLMRRDPSGSSYTLAE